MKVVRIVFLIFGVVFGGFATGAFYVFIKPQLDAEQILKNGTETTATVINIGGNATVNGEPRYYIRFSFINSEDEEITVKTGSLYPEYFLRNSGIAAYSDSTRSFGVVFGKEIQVMYKGANAVVKGYVAESETGFMWIFVLVFGGVGAGMLIAFAYSIAADARNSKIKQYGRDGTGKYLNHTSNVTYNNVPYFRIHFSFEDYDGRIIEVKTGSSYSQHEAEAIAAMQSFPIKYMGDKAVIMLDKQTLLQTRHQR
jgi:hypothetical protein